MGDNLNDLLIALVIAGFEVFTTEHPGQWLVRDRHGRDVAMIHGPGFTWF
jgi:hypothetical protein